MHLRPRVPLFAFFLSLLVVRAVSAQPPEGGNDSLARTLFESARAYFAAARYDDAAAAFAEAYRLSGRPQLLVNQARALESAQRRDEAIAILEQALVELVSNEAALRADVEARLNRLRAERDREAADAAARAEPTPTADAPAASEPSAAVEEEAGRSGLFVVGLAATGLAGASLAVALGTGLRANAIEGDLEARCTGDVCADDPSSDAERGERLARTNTAMLFIAGGAAAVAIPMLILGLRDRDEAEDGVARVELAPGPGDVGLGLLARF